MYQRFTFPRAMACDMESDSLTPVMSFLLGIIKPDKVQLNTVLRPASYDFAYPLSENQLLSIKKMLGENTEVITPIIPLKMGTAFVDKEEKIVNLISRRPCTCDDICNALRLHSNEALKYLTKLVKEGRIQYKPHYHRGYYQAVYT